MVQKESTATDPTTRAPGQLSTFGVLGNPNFTWFIAGTTLTNAATWIQQVTISWLVYDITSSGTMLGTVNLMRSLATMGLATFAGIAIDRLPRKTLLYITSSYLSVLCFGFGLVLIGNPGVIWPLLLFSFLGGAGQAMSIPLRQTIVFDIVSREESPGAVALVQTGWAVMRSIGPAIGGFLILWFGPAGNFFTQAAAYALVTFTVVKLNLRPKNPDTAAAPPQSRGSFTEGWKFIISHPTTLAFVLLSWVLPLFIIPNFGALPPIYAKDIFDGGPGTLGTLMSAVGIGGIIGGIITTSLAKIERRGLAQLAALFCLSLAFVGFALSPTLWVAIFCLVLAGLFEMIYLTTNQTLLQLSIPDGLRGRVTGILSLMSGLSPLGAFIAGIGSDLVGPQTMTLIFAGICALIALVVYCTVPVVRDYRLSEAMEHNTGLSANKKL